MTKQNGSTLHARPDPNAAFVTGTLTRADIAEHFNAYLESRDIDTRVPRDDPRLTDEVCLEYAARLGISGPGYQVEDTWFQELNRDFLDRLGVTPTQEAPSDGAHQRPVVSDAPHSDGP